jgi:hypothetical protein
MVTGAIRHAAIVCAVLWGVIFCGMADTGFCADSADKGAMQYTRSDPGAANREQASKLTWTKRVVTEDELWDSCEKGSKLDPVLCRDILARLNCRARYYIFDDVRHGRPIKVPDDFAGFKDWTPMPPSLPQFSELPRLIVVVKDVPFLGWYEMGRLRRDSMACIGVKGEPTEKGNYRVLEKDPDHYSKSYRNDFGEPAWMPWALRVYDTVWIHAGDVSGAFCSHGCIILPPEHAEDLYGWAETGTPVVIVESLQDLDRTAAGSLKARTR